MYKNNNKALDKKSKKLLVTIKQLVFAHKNIIDGKQAFEHYSIFLNYTFTKTNFFSDLFIQILIFRHRCHNLQTVQKVLTNEYLRTYK